MSKIEAASFTGYIEYIGEAGDFDQQISVRNYRDDAEAEKMKQDKQVFPVCLMFTANVKNGCNAQLEGLHVGDKIVVEYYLHGVSGVSKKSNKYYCINKLNIAKTKGITVIERAKVDEEQPSPDDTDVADDIPF